MTASREDILGQLLIVRMAADRWSSAQERFLRAAQPAGVLLSAPLPHSAEATGELLREIARALPKVPFLAVCEEGGPEDPLRRFLPGLPSPRAAAQKGLPAVARLGELIGEALSLLGFNTNFVPLLDLATPLSAEKLGPRAFGSDPQEVAQCGGAFLRGLRRHKILACGKHFPGGGRVLFPPRLGGAGPHTSRQPATAGNPAVAGKPMAEMWREDLVPYRELLPRLPMVLVSNAVYKAYDFDHPRPASLSSQVVEGLLRIKLGYRGLALASELELEEVRGTLSLGEAAIQSLNAGCDLLELSQEASCDAVRRALKAGLESEKLPGQRIEQALERVRAARKGLAPPPGTVSKRALDQLGRRFESFNKEWSPEGTQGQ
jgi:beta-N-acetylhexosaminidase